MMKIRKIMLVALVAMTFIFSAVADEITVITLADNGSNCEDESVVIEGDTVTIREPGEYMLSGSLSNGQVRIDCIEDGKVILYLNGVSIHNENSAALYIGHVAPRLKISLNSGTENLLSNGSSLIYEDDDEPNGVIFSRSDLTVLGDGNLKIVSGAMDGIVSKDDLKIENGNLDIDAVRHGIKGKDSIEISGGKISIKAGKDGLKSTNTKDSDRGFIDISGGDITIVCGDDPVDYVTEMYITGGTLHTVISAGMNDGD